MHLFIFIFIFFVFFIDVCDKFLPYTVLKLNRFYFELYLFIFFLLKPTKLRCLITKNVKQTFAIPLNSAGCYSHCFVCISSSLRQLLLYSKVLVDMERDPDRQAPRELLFMSGLLKTIFVTSMCMLILKVHLLLGCYSHFLLFTNESFVNLICLFREEFAKKTKKTKTMA